MRRGDPTEISKHHYTAVLGVLILLCTISPHGHIDTVFRAARIACSTDVATCADSFYACQVKGHLEGEIPDAMTPDQFRLALEKLATERNSLAKYAKRWVRDAEDVVQDVMKRLWQLDEKTIAGFGDYNNVKAYATRSVRNASIDIVRRKRSRHVDATVPKVEVEMHESVEKFERPKNPLELLEHDDQHESLYDAVDRLPQLDRDVIVGFRLQGESAEATAERLNLTVHRVYGIAERALEKLHKLIEERPRRDKNGH